MTIGVTAVLRISKNASSMKLKPTRQMSKNHVWWLGNLGIIHEIGLEGEVIRGMGVQVYEAS